MKSAHPERYDRMKYRRVGRSGLKLSALSLGLWYNFGADDDLSNQEKLIWTAFDQGITGLDLGNNYGPPPGAAEENLGKILRSGLDRYRDELIISSKAGYLMWPGPYGEWGSRKYLLASLDQSLKRLGVDYLDIFYSHRFDPDTPLEETMGALDSAVRSGKALYVGISSYSPEDTARAAKILRDLGTPCVIHQPKYNLLDRWVETSGLLNTLGREGIGCIPFCPLAQGLLTNRYLSGVPSDSRAVKLGTAPEGLGEPVVSALNRLNDFAKERGQTLAQLALSWLLKDERVTSVLIGASRPAQIEENIRALEAAPLSADELSAIDEILTPEVRASASAIRLG